MKKYNRQRIILDLIEKNEIKTQQDLSKALSEMGIRSTQATISRDIKELKIVKAQTINGEYRYEVANIVNDSLNERLKKICQLAILSFKHNDCMILIKTISNTAIVCGYYIETANLKGISGIVTGNDTIFVAVDNIQEVDEIIDKIKDLLR